MTAPSERLIRRIRRDFNRGVDDEVIRRLTALRPDDSSERLQAALVLGAGGKWNRFEQQLRRLQRDWRDVLMVGGLADEDWSTRLSEELPTESEGPSPEPDPITRPAVSVRAARRDMSSPRRRQVRRTPRTPR